MGIDVKQGHKAGFVNIVGNPNVGKSTLMNLLVGERISIATFKAQTTRHRIMGILNTPEMQICFSDTPGVLKPNYKLQESMMGFVRGALKDADVILYVTDTVEQSDRSEEVIARIIRTGIPTIVVINKIDTVKNDELLAIIDAFRNLLDFAEIFGCLVEKIFFGGKVCNELLKRKLDAVVFERVIELFNFV